MHRNRTADQRVSGRPTRRPSLAADARPAGLQLPLPLAGFGTDRTDGEAHLAYRTTGPARVDARHAERLVRRERKRLASELHDGLGQYLTGAALLAAALEARIRSGEAVTTAELRALRDAIDRAQRHCRRLAHREYADEIRGSALGPALAALVGAERLPPGMTCRYRGPTEPTPTITDLVAHQLYRIAQEAVRNAIHHSGGSRIAIELAVGARRVSMSIADDGRGGAAVRSGGIGIRTMRDRALSIGATITLRDAEPTGTLLRVDAPLAAGRAGGGDIPA